MDPRGGAPARHASAGTGPPERIERGNLVIEGIPEIPHAVSDRLQQYENARSAYFTGFTEDGGLLITTRFAESSQVHKVDEPMGMRRQLTFYDEPVGGAVVREGDRTVFVFGKDTGGDEFYQGWLFDLQTGRDDEFHRGRHAQQRVRVARRRRTPGLVPSHDRQPGLGHPHGRPGRPGRPGILHRRPRGRRTHGRLYVE